MALKFDLYDIPFTGKLDQATNPRLVPPGSFLTLKNVIFSKTGEIAKRPGLDLVNDGTDFPSATRFIRAPGGSLYAADGLGSASMPGAMYADVSGTYREVARLTATRLRKQQMFADLGQSMYGDVAYCNGKTVHVAFLSPSKDLMLRVLNREGQVLLDQVLDNVSGSNLHCRATTSGTSVLITFTGNSANALNGYVVDCSAAQPSVGGIITFLSSEEGSNAAPHDTCALGDGAGWGIAYCDNATNLKIFAYSVASGVSAEVTIAAVTPRAISIVESGGQLFTNYSDASFTPRAWTVTLTTAAEPPVLVTSTQWDSGKTTANRISAVIARANGGVMLLHSENASGTDSVNVTRWRDCDATGTMTNALSTKRRPRIISKGWEKNARCYLWTIDTGDGTEATAPLVTQPTACLLEVTPLGSEPSGEAMVVGSYEYLVAGDNVLVDRKSSATQTGSGWSVALQGRYVNLEMLSGLNELETTYDGTFCNVEYGGSTYIAGGVLYQWDGTRCFEVGFPQRPAISGTVSGGASTWSATPTYPAQVQYYAVYEMIDNARQRHRSVLSNSYIATLTAATDKVDLELEPLTISRRHWGATARETYPRVIVSIYRSSIPGDTKNLVRLKSFDATPAMLVNDPRSASKITYTDTGTSTDGHELLYTVGGLLENDLVPGGCEFVWVHRDRLWVCGGADADTVRISKTFTKDEPAQFSLGLEILVPGERVRGGSSLDAVNVLFTDNRMHKVMGDGPDDTGNPATGTWSVEPIATDVGCTQPRSIVSTPFGIMFRATRGFYLLDRGLNLQYVGADIQDLTDAYPEVFAATVVSASNHVRFVCGDGENTRVLVFDYAEKKWLEHAHTTGKYYIDAAINEDTYALLGSDGSWYEESADYDDAGVWYGMTVRTGWLPFDKLHGRKRWRRMVASGEYKESHNLRIRYYLEKDPALQEWLFTDAQLSALPLYQVRVDPRWQLGQTFSWEFAEEQPTVGMLFDLAPVVDTEGFTLTGMSAMVGHMGRLRPMLPNASK